MRILEEEQIIRDPTDSATAVPHITSDSEQNNYKVIIEGAEVASTTSVEDAILLLGMAYFVFNQKTPRSKKNFSRLMATKVFEVGSDTKPATNVVQSLKTMGIV